MRLIDADALEPYYRLMQDNATGIKMMALPDGIVDQQPTVDAVPYEYIIQYGCTCDDSVAKALIGLINAWEVDSPTWKPKFNVVRMKGQKNEQV